jgi:hypothetical protein
VPDELKKGDRVKYTPEGVRCLCSHSPLNAERVGTFVRMARGTFPVIHWDGHKGPHSNGYHPDFIMRAPLDNRPPSVIPGS